MTTRPRPLWLIPILMLALAAIACDSYVMYDVVSVEQVVADPDTAGRAYVWLRHSRTEPNGERGILDHYFYVTDDYGAHWRAVDGDHLNAEVQALPLSMSSETLSIANMALWQFPRPQFRYFFYQQDNTEVKYFQLPYEPSNSLQGDVLYVAMGTEGVLVGPAPGSTSTRSWTLTNAGIDVLRPLELTITEPSEIVGIVLLALLIPPLPILHAYLLSRVWAYMMPVKQAWQRGLLASLGLALIAAIAVVVWLTRMSVDYYPMVAAVTAVVVIVGATMTQQFASQANVNDYTRNRLLVAVALVSLIVPAGVAAIWTGWWAVGLVITGYGCLVYAARRYLSKQEAISIPLKNDVRWQVDRLALESLGIGLLTVIIGAIIMTFAPMALTNSFSSMLANDLTQPLFLLALIGLTTWLIHKRFKAANDNLKQSQADVEPSKWVISAASVILWGILTVIFSIGVFGLQSYAYSWFTTLIIP